MSFKCKINLHRWAGCKCIDCGKTRNKQHDWTKDCEYCSICHKKRRGQHNWDGCKCSSCKETRSFEQHDWSLDCTRCSKCGKASSTQHVLDGCRCTVCGKANHNWQADREGCIRCGKIIEVATLHDLQAIHNDLTAHYCLVADIDATETRNWNSGKGFEPIGTYTDPFVGILNGRNHLIKNLKINRPFEMYVGLFGFVKTGIIKDIVLKDVSIKGSYCVGGLIGANQVQSCVSNCDSSGEISGGIVVGGLVGSNWDHACVTNCRTSGEVFGKDNVGGLVGNNSYESTISKCNSVGEVKGENFVGGLVGWTLDNSTISECEFSGKVIGVGVSKNGSSDFGKNISLNEHEVSVWIIDANNVGGLVGLNLKSNIILCSATGKISGRSNVGGLVGTNACKSTVLKCFSECEVNGSSVSVGGLVGDNHGNSTISECRATSNVIGSVEVGGLVGINEYDSTIIKCSSSGHVTGNYGVGGLIGKNASGRIIKCSSSGAVESDRCIGGLVGTNEAEISECFSTGKVNGKFKGKDKPKLVGGMIGSNGSSISCSVSNSYWDIHTSCQHLGEGFGKTSREMLLQATYEGWDFKNTWQIDEGKSYPILKTLQPDNKIN